MLLLSLLVDSTVEYGAGRSTDRLNVDSQQKIDPEVADEIFKMCSARC